MQDKASPVTGGTAKQCVMSTQCSRSNSDGLGKTLGESFRKQKTESATGNWRAMSVY